MAVPTGTPLMNGEKMNSGSRPSDRRRTRLAAWGLVLLTALTFGAGCSGGKKNDPNGPYKGPDPLPYCATDRPTDCFTKAQAEDYANRMYRSTWNIFFEGIMKAGPSSIGQPKMKFVNQGDKVKSWCRWTDGKDKYNVVYNKALTYCDVNLLGDPTVYIGPTLLNEFKDMGELVPGLVLAHEYTHHFQKWANVPQVQALPRDAELDLKREDQADCVSGAWVARANQIRTFDKQPVISAGQIKKYVSWLDSHNRTRAYKENERGDAIARGMKYGMNGPEGCADFYFPKRSIVKGP